MGITFNLYRNADGSLDGSYPAGDKPHIGGGTPALAWSAPQGLVDGNTLTLTTDGTNPFGAIGPNVVHLFDPYKIDNGTMTIGDLDTGSALVGFMLGDKVTPEDSATTKFTVDTDAKIGKGIQIGTSTDVATNPNGSTFGKVRSKHTPSTRTFDCRMTYWPTANRTAAEPYLNGSCTWQLKPYWNFGDFEDSTDGQDFFTRAAYFFVSGSLRFNNNITISSNNVGTYEQVEDTSPADTSDPYYRPRDEVHFIETAWDQGSADGVTFDAEAHIFQTTESQVLNTLSDTGIRLSNVNATQKITDSGNYPGFVRGFSRPDNMHILEADIYKAAGAGAWCRVVISDNADYFQSKKRAIQLVDAAQWANGQIEINSLRTGIFQGDLTGCYLNIIGINNTQVGSVAL